MLQEVRLIPPPLPHPKGAGVMWGGGARQGGGGEGQGGQLVAGEVDEGEGGEERMGSGRAMKVVHGFLFALFCSLPQFVCLERFGVLRRRQMLGCVSTLRMRCCSVTSYGDQESSS